MASLGRRSVHAGRQRGTVRRWVVWALASLALTPGLVVVGAGPANAVPGLVIVPNSTAATLAPVKVVAAVCPAGKTLLGTGWQAIGADGEVSVTRVTPNAGLTAVVVVAFVDDTGSAVPWSLHAYAICANLPVGAVLVTATSPFTSAAKSVSVSCPGTTRVTGAGFSLLGGAGEVHVDRIVPNAALTTVTASAREDQSGYAFPWALRVHAICVPPLPGLVRVTGVAPVTSNPAQGGGALCPASTQLVGTGGEVFGGGDEVLIGHLWPSGPTSVRMLGFEDDTGYAGLWQPVPYAICAT